MKLRVELYQREDRYKKKYVATLLHGNIIVDDDSKVPGCKDKYTQFIAASSPIYEDESQGKVNTRLRYPVFRGEIGENILFCKLNWLERQKLSLITREAWIYKHPVATFALIINTLFLIANLVFAFLNFKSSSKNIESSYLETINNQIEYQINQLKTFEKQMEMKNQFLYKYYNDSITKEVKK